MIEASFTEWIVSFILLIVIIRIIRKTIDSVNKTHKKHEELDDELKKFYEELLAQKLRQANKNNNSKWFKLDNNSKEKILKVRVMAERGEVGGEQDAAKNRLNALLLKNDLKLSDIPAYKK